MSQIQPNILIVHLKTNKQQSLLGFDSFRALNILKRDIHKGYTYLQGN